MALLLAGLAASPPLVAQDSTAAGADTLAADSVVPRGGPAGPRVGSDQESPVEIPPPPSADSVYGRRRVAPLGAFARSLLLPGWGQLRVGRKFTAGLFVATEALTLGMSIKATRDVNRLRDQGADSAAIVARKRTREDWYVLLAVNHLLAGLEAFIAAQLLDFPAELKLERTPDRLHAGFAVPLRVP